MKTKKTVIFMGYACNNMCTFCLNEDKRTKIRDKSTKEIKQDMLTAKRNGTTYIELIGGEPTIRKDILELLNYAKELKFETIMFATNGRMLSNKDFAKKIIESGVNHIVFSIHGNNAEMHDRLTQAPGSFEQMIKGINNIKELGLTNIGSNTTIVKQNYRYLSEIGKLIYRLGIRNAEFIFVDPTYGGPKTNYRSMVPSYEEVSPYVNQLLQIGKANKVAHWHIRYYPLCFVEERYHDQVSDVFERKTFQTEHLAPDFVNKKASESRTGLSRQHIKKCTDCKYKSLCDGYWIEYIKQNKIE